VWQEKSSLAHVLARADQQLADHPSLPADDIGE
jgi:hypothetical protein